MAQNPEDKRKTRRIGRKFMMRVASDEGHWSNWSLVTTQDFSAGGASFTYDQPVKEGQRLHCRLQFADRQIDCKASVIRASGDKLAHVAVAFEWASQADRDAVEDFARHYKG